MKIGIIGAGGIAAIVGQTMRQMENVECYAVSAREQSRADAFAKQYGFEKAYGSYEALVRDPAVELVYVATPHSHHFQHMKLSIEHGKPVLCEKAFTVNAAQAREIFRFAEEKKVFVTEAIWTRYIPMRKTIDDILASGVIGEPVSLSANLGYAVSSRERLAEPALAGGALLDIGVYPINFALMTFGADIRSVTSAAVMTEKGVDRSNSVTFSYNDGRMAVLNSTFDAITDRTGVINGTKGFMVIQNINNCEGVTVYNAAREVVGNYPTPKQISGYEYEIDASIRAIRAGKLECEEMPHAETVRVMEIMDAIRGQWGLRYPME